MAAITKILPAVSFLLLLLATTASSQTCYYPNGDVATGVASCSGSGDAPCCPYQWDCVSNGLCYLENAQYFGRYSCTDQTWQSSNCLNVCTKNNTASGNEAVLYCPDGSFCCDGDRSFDCCSQSGSTFFGLPLGSVSIIATILSASLVSTLESSQQASSSSSSSSSSPKSSTTSSHTSSPTSPSTPSFDSRTQQQTTTTSQLSSSLLTSPTTITNTDGSVSAVLLNSTPTSSPTSVPSGYDNDSDATKVSGLILGLCIALPLVTIIATAILCLVYRRKRRRDRLRAPLSFDPADHHSDSQRQMAGIYADSTTSPEPRAPELDSFPVAAHLTPSGRVSELYGSESSSAVSPSVPLSPAVSTLTSTNTSVRASGVSKYTAYSVPNATTSSSPALLQAVREGDGEVAKEGKDEDGALWDSKVVCELEAGNVAPR